MSRYAYMSVFATPSAREPRELEVNFSANREGVVIELGTGMLVVPLEPDGGIGARELAERILDLCGQREFVGSLREVAA